MTTTTKTAAPEDSSSALRRLRKELAAATSALEAARAKSSAAAEADEGAKILARVSPSPANAEAADSTGTALLVAVDELADAEEEVSLLRRAIATIGPAAERAATEARRATHAAALRLLRERHQDLKDRLAPIALDLAALAKVEGRMGVDLGTLLARQVDSKKLDAALDARIEQLANEARR